MERVVAYVVFLECDGECEEGTRRYLQSSEKFARRERRVRDGGEGAAAGEVADAEYVYPPAIEVAELTSKFLLVWCFNSISWYTFTGEAVCVCKCPLDAGNL